MKKKMKEFKKEERGKFGKKEEEEGWKLVTFLDVTLSNEKG